MASICILDRGTDTSDWLKQLPDCPAAHQVAPPSYNMAPLLLIWGVVAFVIFCVVVAGLYALRCDYKKNVNGDLVRAKVPDLLTRQANLVKQVGRIESLRLDDRLKKVEALFGSGEP